MKYEVIWKRNLDKQVSEMPEVEKKHHIDFTIQGIEAKMTAADFFMYL